MMISKPNFWPPVGWKQRLSLVFVAGIIVVVGWGSIFYREDALHEEAKQLAAEIREMTRAGIVSARFETSHLPDRRKPCFMENDQKKIGLIAEAMARADTDPVGGHAQHILDFTVEFKFAGGGKEEYRGEVLDTNPLDVFLEPSTYQRNKRGQWEPSRLYRPVRIPGLSSWLKEEFDDHGCDLH